MLRTILSTLLLVFAVSLVASPAAEAQIIAGSSMCDTYPLPPGGTTLTFPGAMTCNKSIMNSGAAVATCSFQAALNGAKCRPTATKMLNALNGMIFVAGARQATSNPICSWFCSNGVNTATITLMAPGLPIELMDFAVEPEDGDNADEDE